MTDIKKIIIFCFYIIAFPFVFIFYCFKMLSKGETIFPALSQLLSLFPGKFGSYTRIAFYRQSINYCNSNCMISFGVLLSQLDTDIYEGVYIGPQSNIGSCSIKKNCLLGSAVHILSGKRQHNFTNANIPIKDQGGTFEKITIGENTWIGNGAIIMANIGKNCVIGAGSVVVNEVADNSVMSGNPAKLIKKTHEAA